MNKNTMVIFVSVISISGAAYYFLYASSQKNPDYGKDQSLQNQNPAEEHDDGSVNDFEIRPSDVLKKIENKEDILLLDVRTPEEYGEVHLQNSLLVPVEELSQKTLMDAGLGEEMKNKEIIIYCRSGGRSAQAYRIMESLGYTNIKSMAGGMIHWQEDKNPFTETGVYQGRGATKDPNTSLEKPSIVLDRASHDFGKILKSGGVVTTTFLLKNMGAKEITIGQISTSCGCTSAKISSQSVSPGESAILSVSFDPNFHDEPEGQFTRTVFIPTSDPRSAEVEAKISVEIIK